ncbi:MAG: elongation factor P [Candidatus Aminicenantes bacterium]|nr:elongation factor P [Candidatus Aminicenantes bacterium]
MINATQIRKGMIIRLNDKLYRVEDMDHVTPGKGQAIVQTKIRDLNDMTTRNYRFRSSEKVEKVMLETRIVSYSYQDGDQYIFMDNETYDQIGLDSDFLADVVYYLKEEIEYTLESFEKKPMNITPPLTMEFEVVEAEKSMKGATVQASYKPAKLDSGMEVMVPAFIEAGNVIKIDTRDGSYVERISK